MRSSSPRFRRPRAVRSVVLAVALGAASCSGSDPLAETLRTSTTSTPTTTEVATTDPVPSTTDPVGPTTSLGPPGTDPSIAPSTPPSALPPATVTPTTPGPLRTTGAVAYVDDQGRIIVDRPDTPRLDPGVVSRPFSLGSFPSWSPDGTKLAWLSIDQNNSRIAQVQLFDTRSSKRSAFTPTFVPFYVSWSPMADHVGMLGGSNTEILFGFSNRQDVNVVPATDRGDRYFFSWLNTDGAIVSNNGDRIALVTADGPQPSIAAAGNFNTPVALSDPDTAIVSVDDPALGQVVALLDLVTGEATPYGSHEGPVSLVLSPDESTLAVLQQPRSGGGPVINPISFQPDPAIRELPMGLSTIDLATSEITPIELAGPRAAYFDPTGQRLLVYTNEEDTTQWVVVQDQRVTLRTEAFTPSPFFLQAVLPTFDQFAQSGTPWSPDGSAFVFSRESATGPVVVVHSSTDGRSEVLGPGDTPVWAPTP